MQSRVALTLTLLFVATGSAATRFANAQQTPTTQRIACGPGGPACVVRTTEVLPRLFTTDATATNIFLTNHGIEIWSDVRHVRNNTNWQLFTLPDYSTPVLLRGEMHSFQAHVTGVLHRLWRNGAWQELDRMEGNFYTPHHSFFSANAAGHLHATITDQTTRRLRWDGTWHQETSVPCNVDMAPINDRSTPIYFCNQQLHGLSATPETIPVSRMPPTWGARVVWTLAGNELHLLALEEARFVWAKRQSNGTWNTTQIAPVLPRTPCNETQDRQCVQPPSYVPLALFANNGGPVVAAYLESTNTQIQRCVHEPYNCRCAPGLLDCQLGQPAECRSGQPVVTLRRCGMQNNVRSRIVLATLNGNQVNSTPLTDAFVSPVEGAAIAQSVDGTFHVAYRRRNELLYQHFGAR